LVVRDERRGPSGKAAPLVSRVAYCGDEADRQPVQVDVVVAAGVTRKMPHKPLVNWKLSCVRNK
jgi:hypothetical protein